MSYFDNQMFFTWSMCIMKKYVENVFDALIVLFYSCIVWSEMSEGALSDEIKRTQWQN